MSEDEDQSENNQIEPDESKSAVLAAILSLLFLGLGQVYLGQGKKGISMYIGGFIIGIVTLGLAIIPMLIASAVDAYMIGRKLNSGTPVSNWEWF